MPSFYVIYECGLDTIINEMQLFLKLKTIYFIYKLSRENSLSLAHSLFYLLKNKLKILPTKDTQEVSYADFNKTLGLYRESENITHAFYLAYHMQLKGVKTNPKVHPKNEFS